MQDAVDVILEREHGVHEGSSGPSSGRDGFV